MAIVVAGLGACSESPGIGVRTQEPAFALTATTPGLPLYGVGALNRSTPLHPCREPMHRQFDFWLGQWNVFNPAGTQVGTNVVTEELDGCVVAEHWTAQNGSRGRSINTYDAETGQWHQTWVSQITLGNLRMAGGLENGEMVLHGVRNSIYGFPFFDDYTWTVLAPDTVRQLGRLQIPAIGLENRFTGIYVRTDHVTPAAEIPSTDCQAGGISEATRQLDFFRGTWTVAPEAGTSLGTSVVHTDLSDCLFEERFTTPKGYEAVAFTYWDRIVGSWYRTYIDSEGERLELSGDFDAGRLVLTGSEGVPGRGTVEVRVTLAPDGTMVHQTIETSGDGGTHWTPAMSLVYRPG
jgi:hypothetical protein